MPLALSCHRSVDLHAVARGHNEAFPDPLIGHELPERIGKRALREVELLTHLDRRCFMTETDNDNAHSSATLKRMFPDVHAAYNKEADQNKHESEDREEGHLSAPPPDRTQVQKHQIDDPGDERPGLLRVPAPVRSPCAVRPDRAGDHAEGEQGPAEGQRLVAEGVHDIERRQAVKYRPQMFGLELALLDQVHDRNDEGEGEGRITENGEARMHAEPAALEHRVHFLDPAGQHRSAGS